MYLEPLKHNLNPAKVSLIIFEFYLKFLQHTLDLPLFNKESTDDTTSSLKFETVHFLDDDKSGSWRI